MGDSSIESVLCADLEAEASRYARALRILQSLPAAFQRGESCQDRLLELGTIWSAVRELAARTAASKRLWRSSGERPGPRLSAALDKVAGLIRQLSEQARAAELAASAQLGNLAPQLDHAILSQQMHRAYSRTVAPGVVLEKQPI